MPHPRTRQRSPPAAGRRTTVEPRFKPLSCDELPQAMERLQQIPRLMHQLSAGETGLQHHSNRFLNERERQREQRRFDGDKGKHMPARTFHCHNATSSSPPAAPPARALELVKKEVHRALLAFSSRPIKGASTPRLPSDLLRPFDVTKDGRVSYQDFKAGLRGLGVLELTDLEAEALARDVDGDGTALVERRKFEFAAIEDWGRLDQGNGRQQALSPTRRKGDRGELQEHILVAEVRGTDDEASFDVGTDHDASHATSPPEVVLSNGVLLHGDRNDRSTEGSMADLDQLPLQPPPPPPPPPVTRQAQTLRLQHPTGDGRLFSPTVSFEDWRKIVCGRRNSDSSLHSSGGSARGQAGAGRRHNRETTTSNDEPSTTRQRQRQGQLAQPHSLQTLRFLLERDDFGSTAGRVEWQPTAATTMTQAEQQQQQRGEGYRRPRSQVQLQHQQQQQQQHERGPRDGDRGGDGEITGETAGRDRGRGLQRGNQRSASRGRPSSAPAGIRVRGSARLVGRKGERLSLMRDDSTRGCCVTDAAGAHPARAESILRLRSRGNLVGLRRALSKADPSASGVLSQRELERVIVRRFGAGLGEDEARGLSERYRRDLCGRSMVDYNRLVDTLEEAVEAGVASVAAEASTAVGSSARSNQARSEERCHFANAHCGQREIRGSKVGSSAVDARRRRERAVLVVDVPAEESQLVRRARSKTLALLDRHGSRSVDRVFQLVDPARRESLTSGQLREGLRILAGTDPLTDVEYRALLRSVSNNVGEINCRELLGNLRAAEVEADRGHRYRRMAREAELPTKGLGSAIHFRHSDVTDWYLPPAREEGKPLAAAIISEGRQNPEGRRSALVFQRLRNSIRRIQDDRGSVGPVFEMFRRGGVHTKSASAPPPTTHNSGGSSSAKGGEELALSPAELRAGLGSLGVPLSDADLISLVAKTCPGRRGKVTYPDFCDVLGLQRISADSEAYTNFSLESRDLLSGHKIGRAATTASGGGGGLVSERLNAMVLAPKDDLNLDGGVFHLNLATQGCTNPNFTTTMIPVVERFSKSDEVEGRATCRARSAPADIGSYRPHRRQSPAPAPGLRYTGCRPGSQGQSVLISDNHSRLWSLTGEEAEMSFRHVLGIKARRRPPLLSPSTCCRAPSTSRGASANGPCDGMADSAVDASPPPYTAGVNFGWTDGLVTATHHRNRGGRCNTPRDSDLGFGSDRMRSDARDSDLASDRARDGRITGRKTGNRPRSFSLGAERRYGDWARSSVQHLLRHHSWLGMRTNPDGARSPHANTNGDGASTNNSAGNSRESNRNTDQVGVGGGGSTKATTEEPTESTRREERVASRSCGPLSDPRNNYSRHPPQVTQRHATPYATDLDSPPTAVILPLRQRGIRSGGWSVRAVGNAAGEGKGRRRGRSASACSIDPAATPTRSRHLERAASLTDIPGRQGDNGEGGRVRIAIGGGGGRGGIIRSLARAVGNVMGSRGRGQGKEELRGGELSPTLRWSDQHSSSTDQVQARNETQIRGRE